MLGTVLFLRFSLPGNLLEKARARNACNRDALVPILVARYDSNSRDRHVQTLRQQAAHSECQLAIAFDGFNHVFIGRAPNSAVPTQISVAPSSVATSKSWLIPMESTGNGRPRRALRSSRSSRSLRK